MTKRTISIWGFTWSTISLYLIHRSDGLAINKPASDHGRCQKTAQKVDSGHSALMFAFKGSDAIICFRSGGRGRLGGAHSRRQDPKTPVEQALMRGLVTA